KRIFSAFSLNSYTEMSAENLAENKQISYKSELYMKTRGYFLRNLYQIIDKLKESSVDIILSAYPVELRYFPPNSPLFRDSKMDQAKILEEFYTGLFEKDSLKLRDQLNYMTIWEPESALTAWMHGKSYEFFGYPDSAYSYYQKSRDLDGFRNHSDADFNAALKQLAVEKETEFFDPGFILFQGEGFYDGTLLNERGYQLMMTSLGDQILSKMSKK
ncbi:MAG: hypothetical protein KAI81_01260, partial [Candidatus Marinimicrobia bacterium]|nr:hypothetical protein [Candidatus Neomarinimicrobiota bacterium]